MLIEENFTLTEDYREALLHRIEGLKTQFGKSFSRNSLARACGVQNTYLSAVLQKRAHLSEDQLYLINQHLGFCEEDAHLLTLLHQYQRSSVSERKQQLLLKLESLRSERLKADSVIEKQEAPEGDYKNHYYLKPYIQIMHLMLTLEKFRQQPKLIMTCLDLSEEDYDLGIQTLFQLRLIDIVEGKVRLHQNRLHLDSGSPLFAAHNYLNRIYCLNNLEKIPTEDRNTFNATFSCSKNTWSQLRLKFTHFIEELQELVTEDEEPEVVAQMNFDLLPWIRS